MGSRRVRWAVTLACVGAVGAGLVVAVGPHGPEWLRVPAGHEAAGESVPATEAAWVRADTPDTPPDPAEPLRAGDYGGGAIAYLRFDVPGAVPHGGGYESAALELTSQGEAPQMVELAVVPEAGDSIAGLTWHRAPLLGEVAAAAYPHGGGAVTFDLTGVVTAPGEYRFAVTVPPDHGHLAFAGAGQGGGPRLRLQEPSPAPTVPASGPASGPAGGSLAAASSASPTSPVPPISPTSPPFPGTPPSGGAPRCELDALLVPSCGVLWGVAPDGHTGSPRTGALAQFEQDTGRRQDIYHAYHRGQSLFPTAEEVRIAEEGRILFLNWKPLDWSWAQIARGGGAVDAYLDRLADHLRTTYTDPFFFTVHHEPENDVDAEPGSGREATDYAAMFRHVVQRLRGAGVDNLVTVMDYLAYVPWNIQPWFPDLYPGDDVVDWVGWNTYAYSDPGYGHGDFAEMVNRRSDQHPQWPGFYTWAARQHPDKPLMLAEWGVWHSSNQPRHMADLYESASRQLPQFPRLKALVYFDTPADQRGRDSRPTATAQGQREFQRLAAQRYFPFEPAAR